MRINLCKNDSGVGAAAPQLTSTARCEVSVANEDAQRLPLGAIRWMKKNAEPSSSAFFIGCPRECRQAGILNLGSDRS
ncbi:hypothetical protein, partial [Accumulibacter sp.]|uniref:hypothetical protein n=1 Tax=Accumulibacter sp. TaxID=2053492 RepID=UPI002CAC30AF